MPSNTNHRLTVRGPTIQLQRHRLLSASCREAVLTTMRADGRHDLWTTTKVHAAIAATGTTWSKQTVYKTLHRMVNDGILVQGDSGFVLAASKSPLRRRGL
jgi:Fe2+ or Zn2+ uptake regulation protein